MRQSDELISRKLTHDQINFSAASLLTLLFVDCSFSLELISPKNVYLIKKLEKTSSCLHWNLNLWHSWNSLALSLSLFIFLSLSLFPLLDFISFVESWKIHLVTCLKKIFSPTLSRSIIFLFCWLCLIWGRKLCFTRLNFETRNGENSSFNVKRSFH